jgi:hypothetical protein
LLALSFEGRPVKKLKDFRLTRVNLARYNPRFVIFPERVAVYFFTLNVPAVLERPARDAMRADCFPFLSGGRVAGWCLQPAYKEQE